MSCPTGNTRFFIWGSQPPSLPGPPPAHARGWDQLWGLKELGRRGRAMSKCSTALPVGLLLMTVFRVPHFGLRLKAAGD